MLILGVIPRGGLPAATWDFRLYCSLRVPCDDASMTSTDLESTSIEERTAIFSALGDPIRLQILDQLAFCQQCVCDIQSSIDIAPNLLSYHLRVLREAGLVEASRRGRWVDYRLSDETVRLVQGSLPAGLE
jgi:ArsR family transcriptional regulator